MRDRPIDAVNHLANPIQLCPEFRNALQRSRFPFIVLFMGYSRAGKSTRLNQIITRGDSLTLPGPFVARAGSAGVTVGFQFRGPIRFSELNTLHGLGLTIDPARDADVFLVDCEGMDHLDGCSQGFGKSMFALCQLSAMNVIVYGTTMNEHDIAPLTMLFRMSKVVTDAERQVETGFAVMERDINPVSRRGNDLEDGTDEFEQARHRQDDSRKRTVYRLLRAGDVRCSESNFIVLEQPTFDNRTSYWNSLHDLMRFWYTIASRTLILPGTTLVDLFDRTVRIITRMPNCEDVDIDYASILAQLVRDKSRLRERPFSMSFRT
jgi:hypothetical protein